MTAISEVTRLIVTYDSADALPYSRLDPEVVATLVVDNDSADDSVAVAQSLGYETLVLPSNRGYGGAIMAGLAALSAEFVLIANPDLAMEAADIAALVEAARRYPDADVFVPAIYRPDGSLFFRQRGRLDRDRRKYEPPTDDACVHLVSGAAMLVRRAPFIAAGGFDPAIFLYFEDDELSLRYAREKRAIIYTPAARARHLGNASSRETPAVKALKNRAFGWGWAYTQRKHALGLAAPTIAGMVATMALTGLTGRFSQAARRWRILQGYLSGCRGEDAPFPKPRRRA